MNERIRQLAVQANWWKPLGLPSDWDEGDYVVSPEQMKKFAELIVRECANVAADHEALDIYEEIREHFGVES